jgi:ribosomal protein S9
MVTKAKEERYIEAVGRRKTAIARARITPGTRTIISVNNKDAKEYFFTDGALHVAALEPFLKVNLPSNLRSILSYAAAVSQGKR